MAQQPRDVSVRLNTEIEAAIEKVASAHGISRAAAIRVLLERGASRTMSMGSETREASRKAMQTAAILNHHLSEWLEKQGAARSWNPSDVTELPDRLAELLDVTK